MASGVSLPSLVSEPRNNVFFSGPPGLVTYILLIKKWEGYFITSSVLCIELLSAELLSFTIVIVVFSSLFFSSFLLSFFFFFDVVRRLPVVATSACLSVILLPQP